jgi:hypothetical protein
MNHDLDALFNRLEKSAFRRRFRLSGRDLVYANARGIDVLTGHARAMLDTRLFGADPVRDGKQTPYRGHPVFVAQHATGTCCRGCLQKWHGIPKGHALSPEQADYVVGVIRAWLERQLTR